MSAAQLDQFNQRVQRIERAPWREAYAVPGSAEDADHEERARKTRRPRMKRKNKSSGIGWAFMSPFVGLAYGAAAAFVVAAYWPQIMPLIEGPQPYEGDPRYLAGVAVGCLMAIGWMVLKLRGGISAAALFAGAALGATGVYAPEMLAPFTGEQPINIARAMVNLPPVFV